MLSATPTDDVAAMALTKEQLSKLARSLRCSTKPQARTPGGPSSDPLIPAVDPTLRLAAIGDVQTRDGARTMPGSADQGPRPLTPARPPRRHSMARWAAGTLTVGLVLAASTGAAAIAWKFYGATTQRTIAQWMPQRLLASFLPLDYKGILAQTAALPTAATATASAPVEVPTANRTPSQPRSAGQAEWDANAPPALPSVAPLASFDTAQSIDLMANDIASARQEIAQLKASQQELSRNITLAFETIASVRADRADPQNLRTNTSAQTWRPATPRARRVTPPPPDPDSPRPPMPLR